MKHIKIYINEKLHITTKSHIYTCYPKTRKELQEIIIKRIEEDGPDCNLNDIDVSQVEDMRALFYAYKDDLKFINIHAKPLSRNQMFTAKGHDIFKEFNGDISQWDVSNVKCISHMFEGCEQFNCDISQWDIPNVKDIICMFNGCESFRQNLDEWDVSNVKYMHNAFGGCPTKPKWYKYK